MIARGVAGLVGPALGHELDAVVVEPRPRGVAVAEGVERGPRHRESLVRVVRRRFEDEVAAVGQRRGERHGRRAGRDRPRSGRHFLALGIPGVEPVALGATDAVPLNLRQRHSDRHARDHLAVGRHGHDFGVQALLLLQKVRRAAQSDVPRRRMHEQARAIGDVLARHVLDVPLERVHVRQARIGLRRQRQRKIARLGERGLVAADLAGGRTVPAFAPADELPLLVRKLVDDGRRRGADGRARERPRHRPRAHRRAKEVARRHDAFRAAHRPARARPSA